MRVGFSRFVESDLDSIADYIAYDNPERAVTFLDEIRAEIRLIGKNPQLYRLRPEFGAGVRIGIVGHYAILFRIADPMVVIERVVYGGRDLPAPLSAER